MRLAFLSAAAAVSRAAFTTTRRLVSDSTSFKRTSTMSSLPRLIDVDCNLWHDDLKSLQNNNGAEIMDILDEDAVEESNIVAMVSPSSTIDDAKKGLQALETSTSFLEIKTTVGVHPYHVDEEGSPTDEQIENMRELLLSNRHACAAVGECGLDASEGFPPLENQLPWFEAQVQLAQELDMPLFVHERLAFDATMQILDSSTVPILIHCFTGTRDQCRQYIDRGYYLSVSGFIAKEVGTEVRACLEEGLIPLDKLMVETDAPYMGFDGCRKLYMTKNAEYCDSLNSKKRKRLLKGLYPNVPSSLPQMLDKVVECLNTGLEKRNEPLLSRETVAAKMTQNAIEFFGFQIE